MGSGTSWPSNVIAFPRPKPRPESVPAAEAETGERAGMTNVVAFPGLNLSDMSACLRRLADNIDAGQYPDASALIVVMPVENEFPMAFGFGADEQLGSLAVIAQLEMAKAWFINHLTSCE